MTTRYRLTLASAGAVTLGLAAVVPLYADLGWLLPVLGAVATIAVTGLAVRRAHAPVLLEPIATCAALLGYLAVIFARATFLWGVLPTRSTVAALITLLQAGMTDIARYAPPVPATRGLTLVAVAGVGAIAIAVDAVAVCLRRAAPAGLPLLVLFAVPSAVRSGGLGWEAFVFVASGWLLLLLVEGSDRASTWGLPLPATRPDRSARYDDTSLGRAGRRIGAAALGFAVVVPAFVPGLQGRLLSGHSGSGAGSGPRTTVTYNPITRLREDLRLAKPRLVLDYRTTTARPDYLRLTTLDLFTDAGWASSKLTGEPGADGVTATLPRPLGLTADAQITTAQIRVRALDAHWLPVPAVPSLVGVQGTWLYDPRSETVFSTRSGTVDLTRDYTVRSLRAVPTLATLTAAAPTAVPPVLQPYTQDPGAEVTAEVRALTERIIRGAAGPYAKTSAILAYFTNPRSGFTYSTSPSVPGINSPSALQSFLDGKQGFCEQYASAMAAMMRIAGVPARVAVGFTAGTRSPDGRYRVTTKDAHAWPEGWFAGAGWLRFEPTPRGDGQAAPPEFTAQAGGPAQSGAADPLLSAAGPTPSPSGAAGHNPARDKLNRLDSSPSVSASGSAGRRGSSRLLWLVVLAGAVAAVMLPRAGHTLRSRRRWLQGGPGAGWQQVLDDGTDVGYRWRPVDSPRAAAAGLAQRKALDESARVALFRVAAAAERARYGRHAQTATGPETSLRADADRVRAALHDGLRPADRVRIWLLPRSTVRATLGWSQDAVSAGLDRVDDGWLLMRRLRPRGA